MKNSTVVIAVALMLLMIASLPGLSFGLSSSITSENNEIIIGKQELIEVPDGFGIDGEGSGRWLIHNHDTNNIVDLGRTEMNFTVNGSNYYLELTLSKYVFTSSNHKFEIGYGPNNENILLNSENGHDGGDSYIFYLYREKNSSKIIAHKEPPSNAFRIDESTTFRISAMNLFPQARLEVRVVFN